MVNVLVDNAPPSVSITPSWWIWETADAAVYEQIIPLGNISITVKCGNLPDRTYDYNPNRGPLTFKWDSPSTKSPVGEARGLFFGKVTERGCTELHASPFDCHTFQAGCNFTSGFLRRRNCMARGMSSRFRPAKINSDGE